MNQVATMLIPGLRGPGQHSMPTVFQERSTKSVVMVMALFLLEKMKVFSAVGSAKNNYRLHIFVRFRNTRTQKLVLGKNQVEAVEEILVLEAD